MESMTLNLAQRSFKVIDFGTNRKRVLYVFLVVNSNFKPIFASFQRYGGLNVENLQFYLPHSILFPPHFGAFRGKNEAFQGTDFLHF